MRRRFSRLAKLALAFLAAVGSAPCFAQSGNESDDLAGAWRGRVQFTAGAFASTKDLEFMYVFNVGGTMTESSNYDAAPAVPPAYGVWKKVGARKYEARYQFFQSKSVRSATEFIKSGGWAPDGYGVLSQKITLSADGQSFDSTLALELFDKAGKPVAGGGPGTASATRMGEPAGADSPARAAASDAPVEFLLTSAAQDFRAHPPHPGRFRDVRIGYVAEPDGKKQYRMCGAFQPEGKSANADWVPFVTIKTSGYEQYLGRTTYCEGAIVWIEGEFSSALKARLDAQR